MAWKPEYEANRKAREAANPALREKRIASAIASQNKDPEARKAYMAGYYKANPDKFPRRTPEQQAAYNAARRARYATCEATKAAKKAEAKAWHEANPEKRHAQRLRKYGLTPAQFASMMVEQGSACAICKRADQGFPMIDHCHTTGRVRGLLCMQCNQGIGKLKDSETLLLSAIEYLKNPG